MIWIFLVVLSLSVGDIYGQSCRERFGECKPMEPPGRFPETEEDLAQICRLAQKMLSCLANVAESCEDDEEMRVPKEQVASVVNQALSSIEKVCDPENPGYIAISGNLECISSMLPALNRKCKSGVISDKQRNFTAIYAKNVKAKEVKEENMMVIFMDCMDAVFEIACFTSVISEGCGSDLFQPILQTLMELYTFNLEAVCPDETIEDIPTFAFAYAMIEKEAQHETNEIDT